MTTNHSNVSLGLGPAFGKWKMGQGHHPHHADEETEAQGGREPQAAHWSVTEPGVTLMSPDSSQVPNSSVPGTHQLI